MSSSTLTPYLQLPHILSLTWLAYPILSLVFVLFRLQLSLASSQEAVANAKGDLLTSCRAAEQAATAAASMPRYMAVATNQQFADAINGTMNAARAALVLSLTVMEGIINFLIDLWRSTLLCFLELVIRGGLAILIGAVNELNDLIASAANGLRTSIQQDIAGANNVIQGAIDLINSANPFGDITAPQISVPSLDALQNVQLPSSFTDSLTKLNETLPTFGDIKDKIEEIISKPFDAVKQEINETFTGLNFDAQTFPVPRQNTVAFCDQLDTSVVDDLGRDLIKIAKIGTVVLALLILLLIALNCLLQWYKWRCLKNHFEYTRQAWMTDPTMIHPKANVGGPRVTLSDHNLLILQASASHPLLTRICNTLSARLNFSPTTHTHLQWFLNYIFHSPALACFLIGFFGLLSVQIQLWALGPLAAQYSDRAASTVTDFSNTIATSINNSMYNQSAAYANEINARVDAAQSTINEGVFGWVNSTTTGLNATINELYTDLQNAVETAFGGTILEQPAQEFIRCLIGSKVDAIENALTFMHDNLRVDMPRVNQSVLVLDQQSVDEATRPIAVAAIGGGDGNDQGLVGRLVNSYTDALRKELMMFGIFMALWGVVVLMGICVVLWHSVGRDLLEKRRRRRFHKEQRAGINGLVVPFRESTPSGPVTTHGPIHLNFNWFDGDRRDDTSSIGEVEKAWGSHFGNGQQRKGLVQPAISSPMKLLAMGRTKPDPRDSSVQKEAPQPTWYKRITGILHRKPVPSQEALDQIPYHKPKPNLTIAVERGRGSSIDELPQVLSSTGISPHRDTTTIVAAVPQSRWSTSPTTPRHSRHLKNLLSPIRKAADPHSIAVPIISRRSRQAPVPVPTDVEPEIEDPFRSPPLKGASKEPTETAVPSYFAPPLYYGFNATPPPGLQPPQYRKYNDRGSKETSPPPPLMSPKLVQPTIALAPPPPGRHQHRRSVGSGTGAGTAAKGILKNGTSGTAVVTGAAANNNPYQTVTDANIQPRKPAVAAGNDTAVTPVTKFFSTHHARQSSTINPFIAPFEDDQQRGRVQVLDQVSGWNGMGGQMHMQQQGQGQGHHPRMRTNSSLMSMNVAPYGGIAV